METFYQRITGRMIRISLLWILALLFIQCEGPMGPQGPTGPRGYDGNDGANGTNGIDGTAFAYSAIYDVNISDWIGNANGYRVMLNVPEITEDIYDEGAVLVYRLIEIDPKSFNMLPYTYVNNDFIIYLDFDAYIGSIDLIYKEVVAGVNDTHAPEVTMSFKIVIIEGIPLATLKTMVDVRDYVAVSKLLNVESGSNSGIRIY